VRGAFALALAVAACATPTSRRTQTLESLTEELPDYAPIPDDRVRLDAGVRAMIGGFTVGGAHSFAGGAGVAAGVRHDALSVRAEGEADALAPLAESRNAAPGPLGVGESGRLLRAGAALRWDVFASKGPSCHLCGKHAPPTEIDRLDVFAEGGAGEEWITAGPNTASRGDLELGLGLEVGPRHATDHWGLEVGFRVLVARSLDSSRVDHPVMFVLGGVIGS
jgi:hypothetical protein